MPEQLSLLLLPSLLGCVLIALLPNQAQRLIRGLAITMSLIMLILTWSLLDHFSIETDTLQLAEQHSWSPRLGINFTLGVDGFSLPMLLLSSLLFFIAILNSRSIQKEPKDYYFLLLIQEGSVLGLFLAQDWALFYSFWILSLIPAFFLIHRWGGSKRQTAAINFAFYSLLGSGLLLLGLLLLFDWTQSPSFAMDAVTQLSRTLPKESQLLIFTSFLLGFAIKMPVFPLHGWQPLAYGEAPTSVTLVLTGVLAATGAYGLLRLIDALPLAALALQPLFFTIATISLIYGTLMAWRQQNLKLILAYASLGHMGLVLLGIASLNEIGINGAIVQLLTHGLALGSLFLLVGLLKDRTQTSELQNFSGLAKVTPKLGFFIALAFMGAVGLPGTIGFIASFHLLIGGFDRWGFWILLMSLGSLISAIYAMRVVGRLFTGSVRDQIRDLTDLNRLEFFSVALLGGGILILGFYPGPAMAIFAASVRFFSLDIGV
jgi:NADH-quinone oxidoreductase subunit M